MLAGAFPSLPLTLIDTDTLMHCKHAHTACVCMCVSAFDGDTKRKKGRGERRRQRLSVYISVLRAREQACAVVCK